MLFAKVKQSQMVLFWAWSRFFTLVWEISIYVHIIYILTVSIPKSRVIFCPPPHWKLPTPVRSPPSITATWRRKEKCVLTWNRLKLQGIDISHLGKRKIIFKMAFLGNMLVSWRVRAKLPRKTVLVGGWTNPSENCSSKWKSSPNRDENKTHLKPPPSVEQNPQPNWVG